jgi:hypothetical protein
MAKNLRILLQSMHTKLLIISLGLLLCGAVQAQESSSAHEKNRFSTTLQDNKIDIYPNPAVEYLIVQIANSTLTKTEFEMHSIIGNQMTIKVQDLGQGRYRIPVENFATGYYFLIVKDEEARFKRAFKFLKD